MRVYYVSDLHLEMIPNWKEFVRQLLQDVTLDGIIIFAGDIFVPAKDYFSYEKLNYLTSFSNHNLFVAGNHEYYYSTIGEVNYWLRSYDNRNSFFKFINNSEIELGGYRFAGGTMWSNIGNDNNSVRIKESVHDFSAIGQFNINSINEENYLFNNFMNSVKGGDDLIVVTHFLPSDILIDKRYRGDYANPYFSSKFLDRSPYSCLKWIYGHNHSKQDDIKLYDIELHTCQFGYYSSENCSIPNIKSFII